MNKINYDARMLRRLEGTHPRILLHACCAPCASHCLTELCGRAEVGVYFYNPNLDSAAEYEKRRSELERMLGAMGGAAPMIPCAYEPQRFLAAVRGTECAPEGGARCERCFRLRLEQTARAAKERGCDLFATTLTISPLKDAARINRIGEEVAAEIGVEYLPSDFKKRGGYLHSLRLSETYELYRQNYCGCAFSKAERLRRERERAQAE